MSAKALLLVKIDVPPLRERREDIAGIALAVARAMGSSELPPDVLERLKSRAWPGNVRELRNAIQAYAALGVLPDERKVESSSLDASLSDFVDLSRPYGEQKDDLAERFTRVYLQALIARTGGNQSAAARVAGLDRTYFGKLLVKHGLAKG